MPYPSVILSCLLVALFIVPGFSDDKVPAGKEVPKFLRFTESQDQAILETASVEYAHPDGTTVELIGAVHIADKPYYSKLNTQFKQYDALL